ncbi:MAG TPA: putative LPS assembly protein LptD [Geothrix sp.]|nr:putative LPS assembly protein LptD [Geothrix sp.]
MLRTRMGNARLMLGTVSMSLVAQAPPPIPLPEILGAPTAGELLPLRPFSMDQPFGGGRVPFTYRGARVTEVEDIWVLEQGAIQVEGLLLLADRLEYRFAESRLVAAGNIRLEAPGLRLRCERLEMEWNTRSGEAWALQMDLPPSWSLKSSHVAFANLRIWTFDKVELSPCAEERPGWKASLSGLKVDLDGFATLRNALVQVGPVPVLYLPWAIYPAQADRVSGLLPPKLGASSSFGAIIGLSYYQTLGDQADATFSPEYYSKEGVLWGGEARWRPDLTHEGSVSGQTIHQKSLDARRYRYSLKEIWQREDGWQLTADVNQASDNLVDADFGKGLANLGSANFDSALYLGRAFTFGSLSLSMAEQRSFFFTTNQGDPFYSSEFPASLRRQSLPEGEFRFFPIQFLGPLYLDGGFRVGRFAYRIEGSSVTPDRTYAWNRGDGHTRIHGRLGQWGPFRADLEVMGRLTHYSASLSSPIFDPAGGATDSVVNPITSPFQVDGAGKTRLLGSGHLRLSGPQVGRDFKEVSLFGYTGELKHVVEPYFGLTETSAYGDAGTVPRFDAVDSFPGVNDSASGERSFEIGFKQHILGRGTSGGAFADLARLRIATRYHSSPIILSDGRYQKGWSSIDTDLDVEPDERWRLSFRRSSDLGAGGSDNALSVDVKAKEGSRLSLAYFSSGLNRFLVRQQGLQLGGLTRFWDDRLRFEFSANYDYRTHGFASSQVAMTYVKPCVAYILKFSHVALNTSLVSGSREDRLDLTLSLRGLGDLFSFRL